VRARKAKPKSGHGGKRLGAGRPKKFEVFFMIKVGADCEKMLAEARAEVAQTDLLDLTTNASDIKLYWDAAERIPIAERSSFLESELGEAYLSHVAIERAALLNDFLAGTQSRDGNTEEYGPIGGAVVSLRNKVPKGTRTQILKRAATKYDLTENQVDNLWQAYRRFLKDYS
jgi:hypothetical protein